LDRKARLAATVSINKGKACDAAAPGRRRDAQQPVVGAPCARDRHSAAPIVLRGGLSRFCPMAAVWI